MQAPLQALPSPARKRWWTLLTTGILALFAPGCAQSLTHAPPTAAAAAPTRTIVLIHGMYVGPSSWDPWREHFEARGYSTLAPAWPGHETTAAQARAAHPDPDLAALDLPAVVDHYRRIVSELDEPPVLVGHSMGGLVVQILLAENLGSAGVAIGSAPPKGVFSLHPAFLKSNGRVLRGSLDDPLDMDPERFSNMFVNMLSPAEQQAVWESHARPESRRVGRAPTTAAGKVDFAGRRAPLLLLSGASDRTIPPSIGRKTFRRQRKADAITEYRVLPDAGHWLGGDAWRDAPAMTLDWLESNGV